MDENKNNFLDKNTIMAIGLSILFFIGWQAYIQKKYPQKKAEVVKQQEDSKEKLTDSTELTQSSAKKKNQESIEDHPVDVELAKTQEQTFEVNLENYSATLSSRGMGLSVIKLKKYTDRKDQNIAFKNDSSPIGNFATLVDGKPIAFNLEKKTETHFIGTAQLDGQTIIKEMNFENADYTVMVSIRTLSGKAKPQSTIETHLSNNVLKVKTSMFTPAYEGTEFFTIDDGSEERERIDIESNYSASFGKTPLTSIGTQYFAIAVNDNSSTVPSAKLHYKKKEQAAYASLEYPANTKGDKTAIEFTGFMGPKKYDILKTLHPNFVNMINYGIFSWLSKPMLSMLKYLFDLFKNWGLAIIFLTIGIKLLLLPINISSIKSMKKMQKIQPQLKAIKEKYKEDPQRVNQETMALMKKEKANPVGGCLPMLLQIPVFFALYSVIGQSVELYKSPFIFWIQDLSYQDPFFVLPISVGILYFVQMSLTPQPMDPAQAKVMKFIPILFCFFMITVPSGLTLYFFVNTVFGIGQQFIFQKDRRKAAA